ncbi:DUF2080 family transposase-associated protein [Archaeoglobus sp.]
MNDEERVVIERLKEKYPDKVKIGNKDELQDIAYDENGLPDEGFRKIDVEIEDIRALLLHGKIQLADKGVELVLRKTPHDDDVFRVKKTLKNNKSSGKVLVPAKWVGAKVGVVLLVEFESEE